MPEFTRFTCPGCQKHFRVPAGKTIPRLCPACARVESQLSGASPAPVDDLAAAIAERAAIDPGAPGFIAFREAEPSPPLASPRIVFVPARRRLLSERRATVVGGIATSLLITGLVFWVSTKPQPEKPPIARFPEPAAAWARAKIEVSNYLLAPKTAEFPEAGQMDPWPADPRSFEISSFVDAKNDRGVPIRLKWKVSLKVDEDGGDWETLLVTLDDKPVYASPELKAMTEQVLRNRAAQQAKRTEDRRALGQWKTVKQLNGRGVEIVNFETTEQGFHVKWKGNAPARVSLRSAEGFIGDGSDHPMLKGDHIFDVPPGSYQFSFESVGNWTLWIEE